MFLLLTVNSFLFRFAFVWFNYIWNCGNASVAECKNEFDFGYRNEIWLYPLVGGKAVHNFGYRKETFPYPGPVGVKQLNLKDWDLIADVSSVTPFMRPIRYHKV